MEIGTQMAPKHSARAPCPAILDLTSRVYADLMVAVKRPFVFLGASSASAGQLAQECYNEFHSFPLPTESRCKSRVAAISCAN